MKLLAHWTNARRASCVNVCNITPFKRRLIKPARRVFDECSSSQIHGVNRVITLYNYLLAIFELLKEIFVARMEDRLVVTVPCPAPVSERIPWVRHWHSASCGSGSWCQLTLPVQPCHWLTRGHGYRWLPSRPLSCSSWLQGPSYQRSWWTSWLRRRSSRLACQSVNQSIENTLFSTGA